MISKESILILHELSIIKYGGSFGIRDEGLLESAVARPYQRFDGMDLHPDVFAKASAMVESIIINHPFVDGNKRTGLLALLAVLTEGEIKLTANNDAIYIFIIQISTGEIKFELIHKWLKENSEPF